jgi:hypothetical protein
MPTNGFGKRNLSPEDATVHVTAHTALWIERTEGVRAYDAAGAGRIPVEPHTQRLFNSCKIARRMPLPLRLIMPLFLIEKTDTIQHIRPLIFRREQTGVEGRQNPPSRHHHDGMGALSGAGSHRTRC